MKNALYLAFAILFLSACQKNEPGTETLDGSKNSNVLQEATPSTFTQKLLVEMYSSAVCATCPDAMQKFLNYESQYPGRVIGADIHTFDPMDVPMYDTLDNLLNITAFSSGSFNRLPYNGSAVIHKTEWSSSNIVNTTLQKTAKCGLKINTSFSGNNANISVSCAFNTNLIGDYRLTVYLTEDSVTGSASGYNQSNYYNNTPSSPFYQLGNPIVGYYHRDVLRKVLTSGKGKSITNGGALTKGSIIQNNFTTSISGYNSSRLTVIAFINKVGSTATTHEILNAQKVKLGKNQNWD